LLYGKQKEIVLKMPGAFGSQTLEQMFFLAAITNGSFTLAQFRRQFCTKLAHLVIKKIIFVTKRASLMQNCMRNLQV
jgi:hypothetical protein